MKTVVTKMVFATSVALVTLISAGAASAQSYRHQTAPRYFQGLESRDVSMPVDESRGSADWFNIDRSDRASSPYAGGGGGQ